MPSRYRGEDVTAGARAAYGNAGTSYVELVQPTSGPWTAQAFLEERGEGVYHLGYWVDDVPDAIRRADAAGLGVDWSAEADGKPFVVYLDAVGRRPYRTGGRVGATRSSRHVSPNTELVIEVRGLELRPAVLRGDAPVEVEEAGTRGISSSIPGRHSRYGPPFITSMIWPVSQKCAFWSPPRGSRRGSSCGSPPSRSGGTFALGGSRFPESQ